jgi:hypothetical protein
LLITTPEAAEGMPVTRLYPVADLVLGMAPPPTWFSNAFGGCSDYDTIIEVITSIVAPPGVHRKIGQMLVRLGVFYQDSASEPGSGWSIGRLPGIGGNCVPGGRAGVRGGTGQGGGMGDGGGLF